MHNALRTHLTNIRSEDHQLQNAAFQAMIKLTDQPVTWAYEAWAELLVMLRDKDNHQRAIGAQVLCNLAKSDPEQRMLKDLKALLIVTKDERYVTARHCLQALWKVGVAGPQQQKKLVAGLTKRFQECAMEKNGPLTRYDILQSLRKVYSIAPDEKLRATALALIETETDPKYRKKYMTVWREKRG